MTATVKRLAIWLVLAFIIYSIVASPDKAAEMVRSAFDSVAAGGHSLARFFDALLGR